MKKVILINGSKRSGKDLSADILKFNFESRGKRVEKMSFAEPMKQIISETFGITLDELEEYKNLPCRYPVSIYDGEYCKCECKVTNFRTILQRFGTEAMKPVFGEYVWAGLGLAKAQESDADVVIFSDFRFDLEYALFGELYRDELITIHIQGGEKGDGHSSEQPLDIEFDYEIDNTNKDQNLHVKLAEVVMEVCGE